MSTFIGVPTTTDIAFSHAELVHLERMSIVSNDGCGVLTDAVIPLGATFPIVFRLSSAVATVHCKARVLAHTATTPAGLIVLQKLGQQAFDAAMDVGESATRVVRLDQLPKQAPLSTPSGAAKNGLCLQFSDLDTLSKAVLDAHLQMSQKKLAAEPAAGAKWRNHADIATLFDEDSNLSDRAKDW